MPFDNYTNLQTAILSWLARPGDATISGSVPDMITLFEAHARRKLFTGDEEATTTLTTVAGQATLPLPSQFLEARDMRLTNNLVYILHYVTPETMDTDWIGSEADQPQVFTIEGPNFRFAPKPDAAYPITIPYLQGLPALSNSAPTNWLLLDHPDAYLFGPLAEAEQFIGNDERIAGWLQRRDATLEDIKQADIKKRWTGSALAMRTDVNP